MLSMAKSVNNSSTHFKNQLRPSYNSLQIQANFAQNSQQIEQNQRSLNCSDKINQTDMPLYYDKSPISISEGQQKFQSMYDHPLITNCNESQELNNDSKTKNATVNKLNIKVGSSCTISEASRTMSKRSKKSQSSTTSSKYLKNDLKPLMKSLTKISNADKVFVVMDQKSRVWELRCADGTGSEEDDDAQSEQSTSRLTECSQRRSHHSSMIKSQENFAEFKKKKRRKSKINEEDQSKQESESDIQRMKTKKIKKQFEIQNVVNQKPISQLSCSNNFMATTVPSSTCSSQVNSPFKKLSNLLSLPQTQKKPKKSAQQKQNNIQQRPIVMNNNYVKQISEEYLKTNASNQQVTISEQYDQGNELYLTKSKQLIQQLQNQRKNQHIMSRTQLDGQQSSINNCLIRHERNKSEPSDLRLQSPDLPINKNLFPNNVSNQITESQQINDNNNRENISPTPPIQSSKVQINSKMLLPSKQQYTRQPSQSLEANTVATKDNFFLNLQNFISQKNQQAGNKSLNQALSATVPNNQKLAFAQFAQSLQMHLQDPQFVSHQRQISQRSLNQNNTSQFDASVHNLNQLMDIQDMSISEIQKRFADSNRNYQNDKRSDSSRFDQKLFQYYSRQSQRKQPFPPSDPPKHGLEQNHSRQKKNVQQFQRFFSDSHKFPFQKQNSSSSSQWYDMMSMMLNEQQKERDIQSKRSLQDRNRLYQGNQWEQSKNELTKERESGRSSDWTNFDLTYSLDSGMTPKTSKKI